MSPAARRTEPNTGSLSQLHPYCFPPLSLYDSPSVCSTFFIAYNASSSLQPRPWMVALLCRFLPRLLPPPGWWMELQQESEASLHVLGSVLVVEEGVKSTFLLWMLKPPPHCNALCHQYQKLYPFFFKNRHNYTNWMCLRSFSKLLIPILLLIRSLGALSSSWRPFGPLDFILCALQAVWPTHLYR